MLSSAGSRTLEKFQKGLHRETSRESLFQPLGAGTLPLCCVRLFPAGIEPLQSDLQKIVTNLQERDFPLLSAGLCGELALHLDNFADKRLRKLECLDKVFFRQLVRSAFDHNDFV